MILDAYQPDVYSLKEYEKTINFPVNTKSHGYSSWENYSSCDIV